MVSRCSGITGEDMIEDLSENESSDSAVLKMVWIYSYIKEVKIGAGLEFVLIYWMS